VRRLLGEAARQAVRRCPEIRAYYERIHKGRPDRRKTAIVAVAHYLARMMPAMLRTGEVCRFARGPIQRETVEQTGKRDARGRTPCAGLGVVKAA